MPARPATTGWDGTRLAYWRRERGITQAELAKMLGVSSLTVSFWETGQNRRTPSPANLVEVAKVLKVATTDLAPLPDKPSLAAYREHAGYRQAELAKLLGYESPTAVSIVERRGEWWPPGAGEWARLIGITDKQFKKAWDQARNDVKADKSP